MKLKQIRNNIWETEDYCKNILEEFKLTNININDKQFIIYLLWFLGIRYYHLKLYLFKNLVVINNSYLTNILLKFSSILFLINKKTYLNLLFLKNFYLFLIKL